MKLGFLFDVKFTEYKGEYYSTNLTQTLWEKRYLKYFDEIVVIGRYVKSDVELSGSLVKSSGDRVRFCCVEDSGKLKRLLSMKKHEMFIEEAIKDCDRVVCRGAWGVRACEKLNIPYMMEVVGCVFGTLWDHSLLGKVVAVPAFLQQRNAVKNAPYVCYVTEQFLQRRYPAKYRNIGVSDVELKSASETEKESILKCRMDKIAVDGKKLIIGTAASVAVKYKGQEYVIRALALLKKQGNTNFVYQMAGDGDQSYLKKVARKYGVEDQVEFRGPIPHDKMFDWYDSLDVYIQPSFQEGLPRAMVEAMSRGLPCIGTNTGGIPELVEPEYICNKRHGLEKRIARKLSELNKAEMQRMAERNIKLSEEYEEERLQAKRMAFMQDFCR